MADDDAATPSERALAALRQKVQADVNINEDVEDVKAAILADLAGDNPAALEQLWALVDPDG